LQWVLRVLLVFGCCLAVPGGGVLCVSVVFTVAWLFLVVPVVHRRVLYKVALEAGSQAMELMVETIVLLPMVDLVICLAVLVAQETDVMVQIITVATAVAVAV
jgi:hypothetical protein